MITLELTAAIDAAGTLKTFYFSTERFVTEAGDTPAKQAFLPQIKNPGFLGVSAYGDGRTGGSSELEPGEIELINIDGSLDDWLDYSFEGRPVVIRSGKVGTAYPAAFLSVMTATVSSLVLVEKRVVVSIRDKQLLLDTPALTNRYLGNNALPNGLEGTGNDIKGKVKPRARGRVPNITPAFVNTSKLTYQVSDGAVLSITAVYDRGVSITQATDHVNSTALQAASVGAGTYQTCFAEGLFRLGSAPTGLITADVTQGATAADRTVAQILKSLALAAGISAGDINAADVTALDAANSSVVGLYLDTDISAREAMDMVAASIGAFYGFDGTGQLRMGQLSSPSGLPVLKIAPYNALSGVERRSPKDNGVPVFSVTVNYARIWTVQATDLAGSVSAVTRAQLALEYRAEKVEDASVKNKYKTATEMTVDTLLAFQTDAATEAARLLALLKVRRDIFDVPVPMEALEASQLNFMDVISFMYPRYGLQAGKLFRLIGRRIELGRNRAILTLWG